MIKKIFCCLLLCPLLFAQEREEVWLSRNQDNQKLGYIYNVWEPGTHDGISGFFYTTNLYQLSDDKKTRFLAQKVEYFFTQEMQGIYEKIYYYPAPMIEETHEVKLTTEKVLIESNYGKVVVRKELDRPENTQLTISGKYLLQNEILQKGVAEEGKKWEFSLIDAGNASFLNIFVEVIGKKMLHFGEEVIDTYIVKTQVKEALQDPPQFTFYDEHGRMVLRQIGSYSVKMLTSPPQELLIDRSLARIEEIPQTFIRRREEKFKYNFSLPEGKWEPHPNPKFPIDCMYRSKMCMIRVKIDLECKNARELAEKTVADIGKRDQDLQVLAKREVELGNCTAWEYWLSTMHNGKPYRYLVVSIFARSMGFQMIIEGEWETHYNPYWPIWLKIAHSFVPEQ